MWEWPFRALLIWDKGAQVFIRYISLWMGTAYGRCDLGQIDFFQLRVIAKGSFLSEFPAAREINPSFLKGDWSICHAELVRRAPVKSSRWFLRDKVDLVTLPSNFSEATISQPWGHSHLTFPVPLLPNSSSRFTPLAEKLLHPSDGVSHLQVSQKDPSDSFQSLICHFSFANRLRG